MSYVEVQQDSLAGEERPRCIEPSLRSRLDLRAEWLVLGSVLLASGGQLTIKLGLNRHASASVAFAGFHLSWLVLLGLLIYGMGTMLWIQAVSQRDISYLYPLSALNYVLIALGGSWFLGENVGAERWAGIAVMSVGVGLLMRSRDEVQR